MKPNQTTNPFSYVSRISWSTPFAVAVLCLFVALSSVTVVAGETVSVTATGESAVSFEAAKENALRNAVRETVGVLVVSDTRTADFTLICDAIYSRASGYVRSYKVLEKKRGLADTYFVRIHADVARGKINDDYLAIKNLIEYMGRPQFVVSVEERAGSEHGVGVWTEGAVNDHLETTGFNALHVKTRNASVQRQYMRAVAKGDTARAQQLSQQMGAPYGVDIIAFGRKSIERIYDTTVNFSVVELQVSVVHRDSGQIIASKSVTGKGGSVDTSGMQLACKRAVAEVFPQVLDRILSHWVEDMDRGIELTVQVYDASYSVVSALADKIKLLEDVRSVQMGEVPDGGIANLRVIGMIKARDVADRIPAWTNSVYQANLDGPRVVTARPVALAPTPPAATLKQPSPPQPGQSTTRPGAQSSYLLPAIIIGGFLLVGIVLAAVILRKK